MQLKNLSKITKESITSVKLTFLFNHSTIFIDINESIEKNF
jgi:hypothetical protein